MKRSAKNIEKKLEIKSLPLDISESSVRMLSDEHEN